MNKCFRMMISLLLAACWVGVGVQAAPADQLEEQYVEKIDQLLPGMGAEKIPDRKDSQLALEKMCFEAGAPGNDADREALSKAIMSKVGAETAKPARVWMLRNIERLGRGEVVTSLVALFKDDDPQIRELARRALENNPSPAAAAALRAELMRTKDQAWRVALINALGFRRDAESVGPLTQLAQGRDEAVARAAIAALGKIGGSEVADALMELRKGAPGPLADDVADALLRTGESLVERGASGKAVGIYEDFTKQNEPERLRLAGMHGLVAAQGAKALPRLIDLMGGEDPRIRIAAARCAQTIPGKQVTTKLSQALDDASAALKVALLGALAERGDPAAMPAVRKSADHADPEVRTAALEAIGRLGDASAVSMLAERAAKATGAEREAARKSLASITAAGVDEAMVAAIGDAEAPVRAELIRAAAARHIPAAKPAFLAAANDPDQAVKVAGIVALESCATEADFPKLLGLLEKVEGLLGSLRDPALKADAARALLNIAKHISSRHQDDAVAALERLRASVTDENVRGEIDKALDSLTSYCVSWVVSGPYKKEGKKGGDLIDEPFAPEKENAGDGTTWRSIAVTNTAQPGNFNLGSEHNCCAYVKTLVFSPRQQRAMLGLGSDDGVKAWLNGEVVHSNNANRGVQCDQDKVEVTLKEGWNPLMLKITQGGGDWGFCCAVRAADGSRLEGLKYKAPK